MQDLKTIKCVACEGGVPALNPSEIEQLLLHVKGWQVTSDSKTIHKNFSFKNFYETMSFVNAIAWMANQEGHHPDLQVGYNYCHVHYTTHAIKGLSKNDFICAAKVDSLRDV